MHYDIYFWDSRNGAALGKTSLVSFVFYCELDRKWTQWYDNGSIRGIAERWGIRHHCHKESGEQSPQQEAAMLLQPLRIQLPLPTRIAWTKILNIGDSSFGSKQVGPDRFVKKKFKFLLWHSDWVIHAGLCQIAQWCACWSVYHQDEGKGVGDCILEKIRKPPAW